MNKTFTTIVGLGLLAVIILFGIFHKKADAPVVQPQPSETETFTAVSDGTYCYSRTQEATTEAPYAVQEKVIIATKGNSVNGTKSGTQQGPDMTNGYTGTIIGAKDSFMLDVVFAYTIEGSAQKEQELYLQDEGTLTKFRWPLQEKEGILVPDQINEPSLIIYTQVDC